MTHDPNTSDPLEVYVDQLFSFQGSEEATWKSVYYQFKANDGSMIWTGKATQSRAGLLKMVRYYAQRHIDVYVVLGSQITAEVKENARADSWAKTQRTGANIKSHKSLFVDIDFGEGHKSVTNYADLNEAWYALDDFCVAAKLPMPSMRIHSGGGLHAYWVLDTPLSVDEWKPLAEALKEAILEHGFKCDVSLTADPARILRPPGTFNYKIKDHPRPVRMYEPGSQYSYTTLFNALSPYMRSIHHKVSTNLVQHRQSQLNQQFIAGMPATQAAPRDMYMIADAGCGVFGDALDTHGATHSQPLWNLLMLAATFDVDPAVIAHDLSSGYPAYNPDEVDAMLLRKQQERQAKPGLGWPSCKTFSQLPETSATCHACPFFVHNKSPFAILDIQAGVPDPNADPGLNLPSGYWVDKFGHVITATPETKTKPSRELNVLPHKLLEGAIEADTKALVFKIRKDNKDLFVTLETSDLKERRDCMSKLFAQNVIITTTNAEREATWSFLVSWKQTLDNLGTKKIKTTQLGWSEDGFVYGEQEHTKSGSKSAYFPHNGIVNNYTPVGDLQPWRDAVQVIEGIPELEVIVASAFAAPLVKLSGYNGLVVSAFSTGSGVGKTTALKIAQAVWGAPSYMMQVNDTDNAVMKRIASVHNLPVYYDELRSREQMDRVSDFVFQVVQGREKQRLDATSKAQDVKEFHTLMVACANTSLSAVMSRVNRHTQAGVNRVLEYRVPLLSKVSTRPSSEVAMKIQQLDRNYGQAGMVYAAFLGQYRDQVKASLEVLSRDLEREIGPAPQDRFWLATIAVLLVGAAIANHLGLANFDQLRIKALLVGTYHVQKASRTEDTVDLANEFDVNQILSDFMSDMHNKHMIVTARFHRDAGRPPRDLYGLDIGTDYTRLTAVCCHLAVEEKLLRVKVRSFKEWLSDHDFSADTVIDALSQLPKFQKAYLALGAGTPIGHTLKIKPWALEIPLPDDVDVTSALGSSPPT